MNNDIKVLLSRLNRRVTRLNDEYLNKAPKLVIDLEVKLIKEALDELSAIGN